MFKLGETYYNKNGNSIRVISVDSAIYANGKLCPIVGEITTKGATHPTMVAYYGVDGHYCGNTSPDFLLHRLISNEPTEEESALICDMSSLCQGELSERDKEEKLLKIIRALRNK